MARQQDSATGDAGNGPLASHQQTVHDEIGRKLKEHPAKKGMRFNAAVTVLEIGGALGLFAVLRYLGS